MDGAAQSRYAHRIMEMPEDASDSPDEVLLAAYGAGDPVAARVLTGRLLPLAWRVARRMLGDPDEAEDVAQEAMLRLWRIAPDWRAGEARVSTWLYRVTVNLCTDRLRRSGRSVDLDGVPDPADGAPAAAERIQDRDRADALDAALLSLPDRQREAVLLRHIEGLANPEIAAIMELSVEAVESLTARGKRTLARLLAGRKDELGYTDD